MENAVSQTSLQDRALWDIVKVTYAIRADICTSSPGISVTLVQRLLNKTESGENYVQGGRGSPFDPPQMFPVTVKLLHLRSLDVHEKASVHEELRLSLD